MKVNLIILILVIGLANQVENNGAVFRKIHGVKILEEKLIEVDPSQIPKDHPVQELNPLNYKIKNEI